MHDGDWFTSEADRQYGGLLRSPYQADLNKLAEAADGKLLQGIILDYNHVLF